MFFGLTNSPATFQAMMNSLFHDLIGRGKVVIYLDDILIFSESLEEHERIVAQVLEILRKNKLYLKPEKCDFHQTSIEYLGMIIEHRQVRMDPAKVAAVADWPVPLKKKDLQSFIRFCNYYRRFIQVFSRIARPLHDLTRDVPYVWTDSQQTAFDKLKACIASEPTLSLPKEKGAWRVECNASNYAIGGVLSQQHDDHKWHPVAFMSTSFSDAERRYEIYDKELLAIITCLKEWRPYLLGTLEPFEIWTDHENLTYFQSAQKLNPCQAHWATFMSKFHFVLFHKPSTTMTKADALSHTATTDPGDKTSEVTVLPPDVFCTILLRTIIDIEGPDSTLTTRIVTSSASIDDTITQALSASPPQADCSTDGLITYKHKIYVPIDSTLREEIMKS